MLLSSKLLPQRVGKRVFGTWSLRAKRKFLNTIAGGILGLALGFGWSLPTLAEAIGRRPIAAFGNSGGDLEMVQWATIGAGVRFGAIVHRTDAEREHAYDRQSRVGRLDVALGAAALNGWTVIDMKKDWKVIFPFEKR
jgi:hypothetical protein